jgi:hypothetical protein
MKDQRVNQSGRSRKRGEKVNHATTPEAPKSVTILGQWVLSLKAMRLFRQQMLACL